MMILKLLFAFLFPTLLCYLLVALITAKEDTLMPLEKLAVSYAAGVGILTFIMFLIGAFRFPMSLLNILLACLFLFAYPFVLAVRKFKMPQFNAGIFSAQAMSIKWYEWLLFCAIILRILYSYFTALVKPIEDVDAFANWGLRAKVFFFEQGLSLGKTHGYFLGNGNVSYPINLPLFETWIFNVLGTWNDLLVKAIFPTFLLALIIIFYCSMRRAYGRAFSLFSTYLLTTLPFLMYHSSSAYIDFPLTVYFSSSVFLLINYLESRDRRYLIISALLAGIGAWTKNEGFYLMVVCAVALALSLVMQKKDLKAIIKESSIYVLIGSVFKIFWSLFNVIYHIPKGIYQNIEYTKVIENLYRLPVIMDHFYNKFFFYGNWNIAWFVFVVVLLVSYSNLMKNRQFYGLLINLLCLSAFAVLYYITPNYQWLLDGTTLNRNTLIMMPILVYFISVSIGNIFGQERKNHG